MCEPRAKIGSDRVDGGGGVVQVEVVKGPGGRGDRFLRGGADER